MDMMAADASASDVSDKIKEILYAKTAEKVDAARPLVGAELFGDEIPEVEDEPTDDEGWPLAWDPTDSLAKGDRLGVLPTGMTSVP